MFFVIELLITVAFYLFLKNLLILINHDISLFCTTLLFPILILNFLVTENVKKIC